MKAKEQKERDRIQAERPLGKRGEHAMFATPGLRPHAEPPILSLEDFVKVRPILDTKRYFLMIWKIGLE